MPEIRISYTRKLKISDEFYVPQTRSRHSPAAVETACAVAVGSGVEVAGGVFVGVGEIVAVGVATPATRYKRLTTSPSLPIKPRSRPL